MVTNVATDAQQATTASAVAISARDAAVDARDAMVDARDRAEAAASSLAGNIVTSVNGKTGESGAVTLTAADIGAEPSIIPATLAEMESGTEASVRSMSPLLIKQTIAPLAEINAKVTRRLRRLHLNQLLNLGL